MHASPYASVCVPCPVSVLVLVPVSVLVHVHVPVHAKVGMDRIHSLVTQLHSNFPISIPCKDVCVCVCAHTTHAMRS